MEKQDRLLDLQDAIQRLNQARGTLEGRRILRGANIDTQRPDEEELKLLDASMKKNTALTRKLRQISEEAKQSILDDIAKTNQSKYVSEAVAAISEAHIKMKDTPAAVQICSKLHQRYSEFSPAMIDALARVFAISTSEDDRSSIMRRRATLRLLLELLLVGLYSTPTPLLHIVRQLAAVDFAKDLEGAQASLALLTVLAKAGSVEALGMPPTALLAVELDEGEDQEDSTPDPAVLEARDQYKAAVQQYEEEARQQYTLPSGVQHQLRTALERCFDAACVALEDRHAALVEIERENARVLNSRGDLPEEMAASYEAQRRAFEGLQRNTAALAEAIDRKVPELSDAVTRMAGSGDTGAATAGQDQDPALQQVFEDEEVRAFYESLLDIRAVVPAVLLGEGKGKAAAEEGAGGDEGKGSSKDDLGAAVGERVEDKEGSAAGGKSAGEEGEGVVQRLQEALASLGMQERQQGQEGKEVEGGTAAKAKEGPGEGAEASSTPGEGTKEGAQLDVLLSRLSSCVSKDLADEVAANFCYIQTKNARKRLARALCDVPTGGLQLLPYFARIAATLAQVFPDILNGVVAHLDAEFKQLQTQRDATIRTLEPRIRNMRYTGELCKFRVFPYGTAFSMLKSLLDDFAGHNIDAACALVETAGRFLYRLPDTSTRMSNMLEVMAKLKNVKNLDVRQSGMVDSAYFAVKAADKAVKRKQRPPVHEYIRHLVYNKLASGEVTKVLKKLRRLEWEEEEPYLLATLLRASHKGRYSQIPHIASLAAGLSRYHPTLGVALVDALLEGVVAGLEAPDGGFYQRRVAYVRLLGQLYNYKVVDSKLIFAVLHMLLTFGYDPATPPDLTRRLDPPSNFFRIRLVCTLLETCGQYFTKGAARKKLDRFLPYLQRYILSKPQLPLDVEFDLQELLDHLRVSPPSYSTFQEACQAVAKLEAEAAAAAAQGLPAIDEESEDEGSEQGGSDGRGSDDEQEDRGEEGAGDGEGEEDDAANRVDDDVDDDVLVLRHATSAPAEVDEDFERDFAQLMQDFQGTRPAGGGGAPLQGPQLPLHPPAAAPPQQDAGNGGDGGGSMVFKVVMKRGGREDRTKELLIPVSASMAHHIKEKEEQEAAEKAELKRLVLEAEKRELQELRQQQQQGAGRGHHHHRRGGRGGGGGYYGRGGGATRVFCDEVTSEPLVHQEWGEPAEPSAKHNLARNNGGSSFVFRLRTVGTLWRYAD